MHLLCSLASYRTRNMEGFQPFWKVQSHSTPVLATELRGCSADFLHSGTGYMEITVFVLRLIFLADFSQNFSERALFILKNSITTSVTKISTVEPVTLKKPCLFRADFNHDFLQISVTPTLVKHVDSRRLRFSEHHRAKMCL